MYYYKTLQILLLSTCLCTSVMYAVFDQGKIFHRFNTDTQAQQYVILLSDIHIGAKTLNLPQIRGMKKLINSLSNDTLIAAEDLFSYTGSTLPSDSSVYQLEDAPIDGMLIFPLVSLIQFAQSQGISTINLEYRFLRMQIYELLRIIPTITPLSLRDDLKQFADKVYTTKTIAQEILECLNYHKLRSEQRVHQLLSNKLSEQEKNDLMVIENYWNNFSTKHQTNLKDRAEVLLKFDGTMTQYCSALDEISLNKNLLFINDWALLELKALDTIAQARDKKKIIVAMGGSHIAAIEDSLRNMGFVELLKTNEQSPVVKMLLDENLPDELQQGELKQLGWKYPELIKHLDMAKLLAMGDIETAQSLLGKEFNTVSPEFLESLSKDFDMILPENKPIKAD
jgi:hypothetical protein